MGSLGVLERLIMDILWDSTEPLSANELRDLLLNPEASAASKKPLATTTILTVLSRLEIKGFVSRDRSNRPHVYTYAMSRADHTAELMHQVLGTVPDRTAVLARFIGDVSPQEAETMRQLLGAPAGPTSLSAVQE
ncbi:BlaI/MecI/CopY family transcriptional regulator [Cryobacterium melibiosiphilum]|uniref:BlaI/MecI/CopY family transcriptional regulator n=1 Tax=Cryobacterium melibiosiphilum TaxID=995039 RepID=A0A3A5MIS9_9MICO|nr:BlaI/MecI/CopY family transcriptional regulator [Cryobacterium melibiosiphilum]RJT88791.1 BlaI/MecI/CopY family transcriptional regulator [Cryobacterium melibiosiphilum]